MASPLHPVSVKGVLFIDGKIPLLKNERNEWELPGGRLENGEDPPSCVSREIEEELGLSATPRIILDSWNFQVIPGRWVLIITYLCESSNKASDCCLSSEH